MSWRMTEPPVFIHIDTHASVSTPYCEQDGGWLDPRPSESGKRDLIECVDFKLAIQRGLEEQHPRERASRGRRHARSSPMRARYWPA